jgi:putative tryptophan/tyrosine transport system substrate-binding protein
VRRREFIALVGGTAATWPLAADAQQRKVPVIGFLSGVGANDFRYLAEAFRRGLNEAGYVDGQNVAIEFRFAENRPDRLPALANDLVSRGAAVIVATGGGNAVVAAKAATKTIPIIFTAGDDPVQAGYVESLNRPGGNVTGVAFFASLLAGKGLSLLHEIVPNASVVGMLVNNANLEAQPQLGRAQEAARALGLQLLVLPTSNADDIAAAFATMRERQAGALLIAGDPYFGSRIPEIAALALRNAMPALYFTREFAVQGGLMSYGADIGDGFRRAAMYVGRILKGEKPSDLPVDQASRIEFVINLKTAKALGLEVPPQLAARADEVIE